MTALEEKPLIERFREAYDFGFIKHEHKSVYDALEALAPEIEALASQVNRLSQLGCVGNSGTFEKDISLEPTDYIIISKAEAKILRKEGEKRWVTQEEYASVKTQLAVAEARVAAAQTLATEILSWRGHLCNSASVGYRLRKALGDGSADTAKLGPDLGRLRALAEKWRKEDKAEEYQEQAEQCADELDALVGELEGKMK